MLENRERKERNTRRLFLILLITALVLTIAFSFAWLATMADKDTADITGNTKYVKQYFGGGSGTSGDPYQISNKDHLKNLAWLQYLGYFNVDRNMDGKPDTVYFKVMYAIDMGDYVIPPIGTEKYPFVGNIVGQWKEIRNLKVTNSPNVSDYTSPPTSVTTVTDVNCVGFFGVVGRSNESDPNCFIKNLKIPSPTINVATSTALAGIVAGYLDGNQKDMNDIRVYGDAKINTNGATTYTHYGTESGVLSKYALVGDASDANSKSGTETDVQIAKPTQKASSSGGGGGAAPTTWGGSLSMSDLSARLNNLYNSAQTFQFYKNITITEYADGTKTETHTGEPTNTRIKHYHNQQNGKDDASGSVAFTNSTFFGSDLGYFHTLYGKKYFPAQRTITTNRELQDNEFYITDRVYYLNTRVNVTSEDEYDYCNQTGKKVPWTFNSDGSISSVVEGTTYYLNTDGYNVSITTNKQTGWSRVNQGIVHGGSDYLSCDNAGKKWVMKTNTGTTFTVIDFTDGTSYTKHYLDLTSGYTANGKLTYVPTVKSTKPTNWGASGHTGELNIENGSNGKKKIYFIGTSNIGIAGQKYYLTVLDCSDSTYNGKYKVPMFVNENYNTGYEKTEFEIGTNYIKYTDSTGDYYLQFQNSFESYTNKSTSGNKAKKWVFRRLQNSKGYYIKDSSGNYLTVGGLQSEPKYYITGTSSKANAAIFYGDGPEVNGFPSGNYIGYVKSPKNSYEMTDFFMNIKSSSSNLRANLYTSLSSDIFNYPWTVESNKLKCNGYYIVSNGTSNWTCGSSGSNLTTEVANNGPTCIDKNSWNIGSNIANVISHSEQGGTGKWEKIVTTETSQIDTPETCIPLVTSGVNSFSPTSTNPGYLLSGAQSDSSTSIEAISGGTGDIRINKTYFQYDNLSYSNNSSDEAYSGSELQVLTRNANSNGTVRISDNYNQSLITDNNNAHSAIRSYAVKDYSELGLVRYEEARKQLDTILKSSNNLYGLHFMNALVGESNVATVDNVTIEGTTHTDYQLPRDCFDFNVKSAGFISFFAGSFYGSSIFGEGSNKNNSFFSLHHIIRKVTGEIDHIYEIDKIYEVSPETYVYKYVGSSTYSDGSTSLSSDAVLVFDMEWIKNPSPELLQGGSVLFGGYAGALYYYEIPVNGGEYALGTVSGRTGAYLLYLDIGTSPTTQTVTTETIKKTEQETGYPFGSDFTYTIAGEARNNGNTNPTSAAFTISSGQSGSVTIYSTASDSSKHTTNVVASSSGVTVKTRSLASGVTAKDGSGNNLPSYGTADETLYKVITVKEKNNSTGTETTHITTISNKTDSQGNNATIKIIRKTSSGTTTTESRTFINETITLGSPIVLKYRYIQPSGAAITETRDLDSYSSSGGKYVITMTSTKSFVVSVDTVDSGYSTSTFNGTVMTAGGTINVGS